MKENALPITPSVRAKQHEYLAAHLDSSKFASGRTKVSEALPSLSRAVQTQAHIHTSYICLYISICKMYACESEGQCGVTVLSK